MAGAGEELVTGGAGATVGLGVGAGVACASGCVGAGCAGWAGWTGWTGAGFGRTGAGVAAGGVAGGVTGAAGVSPVPWSSSPGASHVRVPALAQRGLDRRAEGRGLLLDVRRDLAQRPPVELRGLWSQGRIAASER